MHTGNGDEDDLLAGPLLAGVVFLWQTACGGILIGDGSPSEAESARLLFALHVWCAGTSRYRTDVLELDTFRELVAGLQRSHYD